MKVEAREIVETAKKHDNYYRDLVGVASWAFPNLEIEEAVIKTAVFVKNYKNMWHDINNQDPERQEPRFKGKEPLYLDSDHEIINPNLSPLDYLFTFKELINRWAARKREASAEANWYKAQEEFADLVASDIGLYFS